MNIAITALALTLSATDINMEVYGRAAFAAEETSTRDARLKSADQPLAVADKASRIGLKLSRAQNEVEMGGTLEVGIAISNANSSTSGEFYLRESTVRLGLSTLDLVMGYGNSLLKLSQLGVDRFNDIYDMKRLITGEAVHNHVTLGWQLSARASVSTSVFRDRDRLAGTEPEGYALAYRFTSEDIYTSFAVETRPSSEHRYRATLGLPAIACAPGILAQADHRQHRASEMAVLLSGNCRRGNFGVRSQLIWSELGAVDATALVSSTSSSSIAIGVDYYPISSGRVFAFAAIEAPDLNHSAFQFDEHYQLSLGAGIELNF